VKKNDIISNQVLLAQSAAILIWLMINIIQWSNNPKSSPGIWIPIIVRGVESFSILIVSWFLIFTTDLLSKKIKQLYILILLIPFIFLASIFANIIALSIRSVIGYAPPPVDNYFFIQSLHFFIPLTLVLVFVEIIQYKNAFQLEKENKLITEKLLHQSQWLMLRYQVNPHFLFNALNTVRALIGFDDEKARKIVTEMSEYFRYSLSVKDKYTVTIREEINASNNFLEIQKIRFPDNLHIENHIDEKALNCLIPVFSIQTLVENAMKYGLKTSEGGLIIQIEVLIKNNKLSISIRNSGKLIPPNNESENSNGTNTGIINLKNRLQYFDKDYRFELFEEGGLVIANINLIAKIL